MKSKPRYSGPPVIDLGDMGFDPLPVIRQRDRLVEVLAQLSGDEWTAGSRCEGWSVQDVAEHLISVNQFWVLSIGAGLREEPTEVLATFDPVTVPAAMVEAARGAAPADTLERLASSNAELATLLRSISESDLRKVAEAPVGHLAIGAVCTHALWDAWVHERDVLVPLGREPEVEPDEVVMALAYAAALGPAYHLNAGTARSGSLVVRGRSPSLQLTVHVARQVKVRRGVLATPSAAIEGDAVDLVEALSCRGRQPDVDDEHRWLVDGLCNVFTSRA